MSAKLRSFFPAADISLGIEFQHIDIVYGMSHLRRIVLLTNCFDLLLKSSRAYSPA